jgi:hypothetical protein
VGARRKVDAISGHRRVGGVQRDTQSPLPGVPTIGVLELGVSRDGDK